MAKSQLPALAVLVLITLTACKPKSSEPATQSAAAAAPAKSSVAPAAPAPSAAASVAQATATPPASALTTVQTAAAPAAATGLKADYDRAHAAQVAEAEIWFKDNLLSAYEAHGVKDPQWDASLRRLLAAIAHLRATEGLQLPDEIIELIKEIEFTHCTDPYFSYLCLRYDALRDDYPRRLYFAPRVYEDMKASNYPPLQKYYSAFRAGISPATRHGRGTPADQIKFYGEALDYFQEFLADPKAFPREVSNAVYYLADQLSYLQDPATLRHAYEVLGPILTRRWPDDPDVLRALANMHYRLAREARSEGWTDGPTRAGAAEFQRELEAAAFCLQKSWGISPHSQTATLMMYVVMDQQKGREQVERWFDRAMTLNPDNDQACTAKLVSLQPHWKGTPEQILAFAKECLRPDWGGSVPLVAARAVESVGKRLPEAEQAAFFQDPANWKLMRAGYRRYFTLSVFNNEDANAHGEYLYAAARAHAWKDFHSEMRRFPPNADRFGGTEKFTAVMQEAMNHVMQEQADFAGPEPSKAK